MKQRVTGLDEFDVALSKLISAVSGDGLVEITDAAAGIIQPEVMCRVPVHTGHLSEAIESISEQHDKHHATTVIQVADSAPGGVNHYAVFEEFGTSKKSPHSFFRPGFAIAKKPAAQAAQDKLNQKIKEST